MGNCNCKSISTSPEQRNQIKSGEQPPAKTVLQPSLKYIINNTIKDEVKIETVKEVQTKRKPKIAMLLRHDDDDIKDNVILDQNKVIDGRDEEQIRKTLKSHFIFSQLPQKELDLVIKNMKYCTAKKDEYIFKQGDIAGAYYIILEGSCAVEINNIMKKIITFGDSFGDLGIVYRAPRSASVKAITNCQLVEMGRKSFNKVMEDINLMYQSQNKIFLKVLSFYENLTESQKNALASSCITETYEQGQIIFNQGDDANSIYIIKKGIVVIKEKNIQLKQKESFGENCLFAEEGVKSIRSHTLVAKTPLQIISISRQTFSSSFGDNIKNTLKKNLIYKIIKESNLYKVELDNQWLQSINQTTLTSFKTEQIIIPKNTSCQKFIYVILNSSCQSKSHKYQANSILQVASMNNQKFIFNEDIRGLKDGYIGKVNRVKDLKQQMIQQSKGQLDDKKLLIEDFYVVRELRSGNFGKVIASYNKKTQKLYAIKVLEKKSIQCQQLLHYVMNEEQILRTAPHHPFLVRFNKLFKDNAFIYIVMELIEGQDLFDAMSKISPLDQNNIQFYAAQVLLVIQHLHNNRIIYRDLKPQNIMVRRNGFLTLVDLGTAKKLRIQKRFRTKTIIGTPHYMAPEIISGKGYSFPVDLWSLGILIYELSCNRLPFGQSSEDPFCIYQEIIGATLKYPRNCQKNVKNLIERLLNKNPTLRIGNGFEELKRYQLFLNFNWGDLLQKKIKPYYFPPASTKIDNNQITLSFKNQNKRIQNFCLDEKGQSLDID